MCGRIMDKWVVRGLDAHRTDYSRTGASVGAMQRYSYEPVRCFAGQSLVGGFALPQSCTMLGCQIFGDSGKTRQSRQVKTLVFVA